MKKQKTLLIGLLFWAANAAFSADWYVRPAGGAYGAENGTSYANAWDGLRNVVWGAGGVRPGDTLWVCGLHVWNYTGGAINQGWTYMVGGTADNARVTVRGDYPGDRGEIYGGNRINHEAWVNVGNNTWSIRNPHSWGGGFLLQDVAPGGSHIVLSEKSSIQEVKDNPGSFYCVNSYVQGEPIYVHCTDNGNPTGRICTTDWGYSFHMPSLGYITFRGLDVYGMGLVFGYAPQDNEWVHHVTWESCKLFYGDSIILGFREPSHDIEFINCEVAWAKNGLYFSSNTVNSGHNYTVRGCTFHDMGIRQPDSDSHAIGVQAWDNALIENNYAYNCGTTIAFYAGAQAPIRNTIVRYNFIRDTHQRGGTFGWAIYFGGNDNNDADKSGVQCYGNIVVNASHGYEYKWEEQGVFYNNVAYDCDYSFYFLRNPTTGHGGPNVKMRNNISLYPRKEHIHFAAGVPEGQYALDSDNNLFYPAAGDQFLLYDPAHVDFMTLSEWQAHRRSGCTLDPNSFSADPKFTNAGGSWNAETDFQLQPSSPAIDKGVGVGLTRDRQGTSIPQGFAPDLGALEYILSSNPVRASAAASPTSGRAPLAVGFAGSASGGTPPYAYNWNFGDGQTSTNQSPFHTYSASGNFTAILTVTDSQGSRDSSSLSISVTTTPAALTATASASPVSGQAPLTVGFSGNATGGSLPYSYRWSFGDGNTSATQNPSHAYSVAGNYTATLTVTDSSNATSSKSLTITVTAPASRLTAAASATPSSGSAPLTANFTGTATGGTAPYSYAWTFGDGGTSTDQNPTHTYTATGNYTATLSVTDGLSATANATVTITVSSSATTNLALSAVTGSPAPGPGGTTNPAPGNYSFALGSTVQISSVPNEDYRFSLWNGDITALESFNSAAALHMDASKSLSATFCTKCADVNGDLQVTPADAQKAFDIYLNKVASPSWCELENADVKCDGTKLEPKVTPADAQMIFNKYLKKGVVSSDCSGNSRPAAALPVIKLASTHVTMAIDGVRLSPGGYLELPVIVESPSEIKSFGFDLAFPSEAWLFVRMEGSDLTRGYDQLDANLVPYQAADHGQTGLADPNPHLLRVGGYKTGPEPNPGSGILVTLVFRVTGQPEDGGAVSVLAAYDDLESALIQGATVGSADERRDLRDRKSAVRRPGKASLARN